MTGANKGIGFAVVKRLLELGLTVVLTARNEENGSHAVDCLRRIGFRNVCFFCLDVSDPSSIAAFVSWFRLNFGVLDILVYLDLYDDYICNNILGLGTNTASFPSGEQRRRFV